MNNKFVGFEEYDEVMTQYLDNIFCKKTKEIMKRKLLRESLEDYFIRYKGNVYISKEFICKWCKSNKNIIEFNLAIEMIKELLIKQLKYEVTLTKISNLLKEKVEVFNIYLFNKEIRVVKKDKFELILDGINYIKKMSA